MANTAIISEMLRSSVPEQIVQETTRGQLLFDWVTQIKEPIHKIMQEFKTLIEKNFVEIENKPFIWVRNNNVLICDTRRKDARTDIMITDIGGVPTGYMNYSTHDWVFTQSGNPLKDGSQIINGNGRFDYVWYYCSNNNYPYKWGYSNSTGYRDDWGSAQIRSDTLYLPVHYPTDSAKGRLTDFLKYGLIFKDMTEESKKIFKLLIEIYSKGGITVDDDASIGISTEFLNALKENKYPDILDVSKEIIEKAVPELTFTLDDDFIETQFLKCDTLRAGITPYDKKRLEDINLGHWDLWTDENDGDKEKIKISNRLVARNPEADILQDGVVAIDFGTKSTVVVFQNGSDFIMPMRIGQGDLTQEIKSSDYENPTFMEFLHLDDFMKAYRERKGRPFTKWNDLIISHQAASEITSNTDNGDYFYTFFNELKQWADDKGRHIMIKDRDMKEYKLPAFVELKEGDMNPIEIYAYYLGLFINNMYNGIFLDYVMSFPVNYERKVRENILRSFERGLKKSLPVSILENEEVMEHFRVAQGASEPAAYAVCALKEFGFAESEKNIYYGIFDFGGGTTDFDFGVWSMADGKLARRYDNVITHFGAGGDKKLGGENLLELLAFQLFLDNEPEFRKNQISVSKPPEWTMFHGSEQLVSVIEGQNAKLNTRKLMEALRPFWEGIDDFENKDTLKIDFCQNNGESFALELVLNMEKLRSLIHDRIEQGVHNFFEALTNAFTTENAEDAEKVLIFLAGNSSKSAIVKELFDEYMQKYTPIIKEKLNKATSEELKNSKELEKMKSTIQKIDSRKETLSSEFELLRGAFQSASLLDEDAENGLFLTGSEALMKRLCGNMGYTNESDFTIGLSKFGEEWGVTNLSGKLAEFSRLWKQRKKIQTTIDELEDEEETNFFKLYPPLGSEEAKEMFPDREYTAISPNAKTGVAFGLVECRAGSRIKVQSEIKENDEIKFRYYLGYSARKKFQVVIDRDTPYRQWVEFIDAMEEDFEIYYTDLPEAVGNSLDASTIRKKHCRLPETNDDAMVYLRILEPSVIEFVAALPDCLEKGEYIADPVKVTLD